MNKKIAMYICFSLFSIFYLLTSSRINVPGITMLRWLGSVLLLLCTMFFNRDNKLKLELHIPKVYIFLFVALIPTFLGISGKAIIYSYERIISLFLLLLALENFFNMEIWENGDYIFFLKIYATICFLLMIYSILYPNIQYGRMTGVYKNANCLSCIASFSFAASIALLINVDRFIEKIIWLLNWCVSGYCVIESGSRIGLAILVITIVISIIIYNVKLTKQSILIYIISLIASIFLIMFLFNNIDIPALDRFKDFNNINGSAFNRGDTWKDVITIFMQKPLFGWGYGTVGYNVFVNKNYQYSWGMHSSYFIILCEMGILGSMCFVLFFLTYYRNILFLYNKTKTNCSTKNARMTKFLLLCNFALLINAYSESFLFSVGNPMAVCFWFPFILSYNRVKNGKQGDE